MSISVPVANEMLQVMTSGGVLSLYDQVTDNQFTLEEISAMVQEAARAKRVVAAHAHSHGGIQSAIDAGRCADVTRMPFLNEIQK